MKFAGEEVVQVELKIQLNEQDVYHLWMLSKLASRFKDEFLKSAFEIETSQGLDIFRTQCLQLTEILRPYIDMNAVPISLKEE